MQKIEKTFLVNKLPENLGGLVFVEVEFASERQMNSIISPEWFGKDVTQKDFSANVFLAGKKYSEIVSHFNLLNY